MRLLLSDRQDRSGLTVSVVTSGRTDASMRCAAKVIGLATAIALMGLVATAPSKRSPTCADTLAAAFVYHEVIDAKASLISLINGRWSLVRYHQLGSGAWACLTPLKQQELRATLDVTGDDTLASAIQSRVPGYNEVRSLGSLPQPGDDDTYMYVLTAPVTTHVLVAYDDLLTWARGRILGARAQPHLKKVVRSRSGLLFVHIGEDAKVDRFGFVGGADG